MLIRKQLLNAFLLFLTILFLNACGASTPTESLEVIDTPLPTKPTSTATPTPIPNLIDIQPEELQGINIQVASAFVGASQTAFNDMLAKFNTLNEWGITAYKVEYDSYNTLFNEVTGVLKTNDQPDMVITLPEQILSWDAPSVIVSLDSYLHDPRYGLTKADFDDFTPIFSQLAGLEDSQITSLPAEISTSFLFYNRTWAMELGFNEAPETFEQFNKQTCAANDSFKADTNPLNDWFGGWVVETDPASILSWMHAFDGTLMDDGELLFSSEINASALENLKSLYDDHCAWISTAQNHYQALVDRSALFISADLAEISDQALAFEMEGNPDEWTILPFPGIHTSLVAAGPEVAILEGDPEVQLASWLFTRWMLSTESQVQWLTTTGSLPLRESVIQGLEQYSLSHPLWVLAVNLMADLSIQPRSAEWRIGRLVLGDAAEFIFRTDQDIDQIPGILEEMDATIQELTKP